LFLALWCSASLARAELRVATIFSDHMVLQRDRPAPIWGWTAPGEAVTVTFAGQTRRATADAQGRWRVTLDPLPANSTGRDLTVAAEGATPQRVTIQDVLVGAVWFTAGQSNINGIVAPLGPFALRGVLYDQGEYNGGRGAEFQVLFPALIRSWRASLEQPNLPFLFVQLPGFIEHRAEQDRQLDMDAATLAALHQPTLSGVWTDLREAQGNVWRSVPHTGMAVTIDVGEPYDIHPKQKEPVAERLLLSARQVACGENVEGSSPVPARVEVDDDCFRVTFEHVGGGLMAKPKWRKPLPRPPAPRPREPVTRRKIHARRREGDGTSYGTKRGCGRQLRRRCSLRAAGD
jgi:hypothetical protein